MSSPGNTATQAAATPPARMPMPALGMEFSLTYDDRPEDQPLAMVAGDGYGEGWTYHGTPLKGTVTRTFKRKKVGRCRDLAEMIAKATTKTEKPAHGQFRNPFKRAFEPDGTPNAFPDGSWEDSDGNRDFPYVYGVGNSRFFWTDVELGERWVVVVEVVGK